MERAANVWSDAREFESAEEWAGERSQRLPRGERLGATLYEIDPGRTTQLSVMALTNSQFGTPLCGIRTLDEPGR